MMRHVPTDMTVSVEADVTLTALQSELRKAGQWLPLDPPQPDLTLREILDHNESGPRRYGYGTIRDYVIGLKVELAGGRLIKSGGQVVKNVAGYDLQKLFIGAGGTLGTAREIVFKLRPLPETERTVRCLCRSLDDDANDLVEKVVSSEFTPVVFDCYRDKEGTFLVLGFDGMKDEIEWQLELAARLEFKEPAIFDYDKVFRANGTPPRKTSVLPSKMIEALRALGDQPFVARAGNGIIFHRTTSLLPTQNVPTHLMLRVKDAFDPKHLLPELPS